MQLPPKKIDQRTISPEDNCPRKNCPLDGCPRQLPPRIIVPKEYHPPPGQLPRKIASMIITPRTIVPRKKITVQISHLYNSCIISDLSLVTVAPSPMKNCPKNNLYPIYFSRRIGNRSTFIDSCFSFFRVWIGIRF